MTLATTDFNRSHYNRTFLRALGWNVLLILGVLPVAYYTPLGRPLLDMQTVVHEWAHGLVAAATGGRILSIEVYSGGGGATSVDGGNMGMVHQAGYIASALVGALILAVSGRKKSDGTTLLVLAFLFAIPACIAAASSAVLAGFIVLGLLVFLLWYGCSPETHTWLLRGTGVVIASESVVANGFLLVRGPLGLSNTWRPPVLPYTDDLPSDATLLANLRGGSETDWALEMLGISLVFIVPALILAVRNDVKRLQGGNEPDDTGPYRHSGALVDPKSGQVMHDRHSGTGVFKPPMR